VFCEIYANNILFRGHQNLSISSLTLFLFAAGPGCVSFELGRVAAETLRDSSSNGSPTLENIAQVWNDGTLKEEERKGGIPAYSVEETGTGTVDERTEASSQSCEGDTYIFRPRPGGNAGTIRDAIDEVIS
jgi:hypothetical protein